MGDNPGLNNSTWTIPITQEAESHPDLVEVSSRSTYPLQKTRKLQGSDTYADYRTDGEILKRATSKKPETNFQKRLLISVVLLAFITVILIIAVGILSHHYNETKNITLQPVVCTSNECIETAANFLEAIDTEIDPCEDFYKFACGKWHLNHPIPDFSVSTDWFYERKLYLDQRIREALEHNSTKVLPDPVVQARRLYHTCLNTDAIEKEGMQPVFKILDYAGLPKRPKINSTTAFSLPHSYPILNNSIAMYTKPMRSNLSAKHRWLYTLVGSRRVIGKEHLIGFGVFPHPMNRSMNVLTVGSPNMRSPLPDYSPYDKEHAGRVRGWRWQELPSWAGRQRTRSIWRKAPWNQRRSDEDVEVENNDDSVVSARLIYMESMMKLMDMWNSLKNVTIDPTVVLDYTLNRIKKESNNEDHNQEDMRSFVKQIDTLQEAVFKLYLQAIEEEADKDAESLNGIDRPPPFEEMELKDLQRLTDDATFSENRDTQIHIDWEVYFNLMFKGINITLDFKTDLIIVQDLNYLKNLARLLAKTTPSVLEGLLWWEAIYVMAPHSNSIMRHLHSTYLEKMTGGEVPRSRAIRCSATTNEMMGMAVSWLLADEELSSNKTSKSENEVDIIERTRGKVEEMLTDIRETFSELVTKLEWMDKDTKEATLKKAKVMKSFVGYPSWLMIPEELEYYYEGLQIASSGYLQNLLSVVQVGTIWSLKDLRNENSVETWATDPTDVNAFHTFQDNAITIPAGILQFPFYGLGMEALNYGAIGSILGHELTHGFDNSGRRYDENGNWRQWWSNKTIVEYINRTSCFVKQYSSYWMEEANGLVNGKRTLGENIADNGGIQEALRAFKRYKRRSKHYIDVRLPGLEQFSQDQLLFLSFANLWCEHGNPETYKWVLDRDEHSPGKARVWGSVSNSEDFSKLFSCPVGSPMNPKEKCRIW